MIITGPFAQLSIYPVPIITIYVLLINTNAFPPNDTTMQQRNASRIIRQPRN